MKRDPSERFVERVGAFACACMSSAFLSIVVFTLLPPVTTGRVAITCLVCGVVAGTLMEAFMQSHKPRN